MCPVLRAPPPPRVAPIAHLNGARPEGHVDEDGVEDDGDLPVGEGVDEGLAVVLLVPLVVGVHGDTLAIHEGLQNNKDNKQEQKSI